MKSEKKFQTKKNLVCLIAVFFLFASQLQGEIFQVTNSADLQKELNKARTNGTNDIIRLAMGTYVASGPFIYGTASNDNLSVTLSGGWANNFSYQVNNAPDATKLDGGGLNPVLQILADAAGVNTTFIVENLTIENGYTRSSDYAGAGIMAYTGVAGQGSINLTIRDCIFQNNIAGTLTTNNKSGGAIFSNCSLEVRNTKFLSNSGSSAGAMYITFDPDTNASVAPVIDNCYFEDNYNYGNQGSSIWHNVALQVKNCTFKGRTDGVSSSGNGSCIWGNKGSHLNITNSTFSNITIKYWGAAIQTWDGDMDITNCLFANNHSGFGVGGDGYGTIAFLDNDYSQSHTINITNCTFTANTATSSSTAAIHNRGGMFNLNNCIFWDNDNTTGVWNDYGTITMRYCCYGNNGMGYGVTDGGHNFYKNPMFIDDDVFRLGAESPCIDAGNNNLVPVNTTLDVAGLTRFRDDPYTADTGLGTAPIVDIGAYEFQLDKRFGTVNGKKNVKLSLKDNASNVLIFSLTGPGWGAIDGNDPNFSNIEIYWPEEKSQLTIATKAKDGTKVGDITCFGPLKGIAAKTTDIKGTITIGSTLNPKAAATIAFDEAEGLDINSDMPIKSITAFSWWGTLTAPSVGTITTKDYLGADIKTGVIGTVKANEIDGSWDCLSVSSITAFETDDFYLTLSLPPDPAGKKFALGKMTIKEEFSWSRIISSGNIGMVTAGEFRNSNCFAGVDSASLNDLNIDSVFDLPAANAANFNGATIKSISIKGYKGGSPPYFTNSNIAAANILSASIAYPKYDNDSNSFGITADKIKSLKIKDDLKTPPYKGLDAAADITVSQDAKIRIY